ncbi:MAG TPA: DUF47 family protein [Candidatus Bathyarchaeia archaeon]
MRNLLMLCQDHARLAVESYRKVLAIADILAKKEGVSDGLMDSIKTITNEANTIKTALIKELHEVGGVLVNRDDFFRLISVFGDIMDEIKGTAARLIETEKRGWTLTDEVAKGILELADLAFDSLIKLREAMMSLGFNSDKSIAFTRQIDEIEKRFDERYVEVQMSVVTSTMELPAILILKDTVNLMENMVDKVRDASDHIRIIAL